MFEKTGTENVLFQLFPKMEIALASAQTPTAKQPRKCSFVNDVRPEKAKEFCLWRIDFSDGGRA